MFKNVGWFILLLVWGITALAITYYIMFCCFHLCNRNICRCIIFVRPNRETDIENNIEPANLNTYATFNPLFIPKDKSLKADKCTICLEAIGDRHSTRLSCNHEFHTSYP